MEQYNVSIIVPVYNREEIIKPCIESINSQTYDKSKWEVIFVDDASTDNSIDTIESLIDKSINYRILKRPIGSGNASAPRNEGIKASSSKYVFFLDSDDYVDSQLLKNGMAIASRNNSDMVYFKMALGPRINTVRPFRKKFVDVADIQDDHLMRSLKVFKLYKTEMLVRNNVFFDVTVDVFEDMLFTCYALNYANVVSILADRDYYYATAHDGEHLSKKKISMQKRFAVYFLGLQLLYSNQEPTDKLKFYNAWLIRCVEHFRDVSKKSSIKDLSNLFKLASSYFNIHRELFDLSQVYENERLLTLLFLTGDFKEFHRIANESKVLNNLQLVLQEKLKNEDGFSKAWVFNNKVTVLDFTIKDKKIAFDLKVDEKKKILKVWIFSRNKPDLLEFLSESAIEAKENKFLIFDGALSAKNEVVDIIRNYLDKLRAV